MFITSQCASVAELENEIKRLRMELAEILLTARKTFAKSAAAWWSASYMSAAARARIPAAQRAMWARVKAVQKKKSTPTAKLQRCCLIFNPS